MAERNPELESIQEGENQATAEETPEELPEQEERFEGGEAPGEVSEYVEIPFEEEVGDERMEGRYEVFEDDDLDSWIKDFLPDYVALRADPLDIEEDEVRFNDLGVDIGPMAESAAAYDLLSGTLFVGERKDGLVMGYEAVSDPEASYHEVPNLVNPSEDLFQKIFAGESADADDSFYQVEGIAPEDQEEIESQIEGAIRADKELYNMRRQRTLPEYGEQ